MYDLVIIGGGPAGVAAGVYAARKRIKTLYLTDSFGGQSLLSPEIQNWIGIVTMTGLEMAEKVEQHLRTYAEDVVEIKTGERVSKIEKINKIFKVITAKGESFETKALILA
ncbi:MAG: FAD-dependent oxidoreductase, partial [Firmicutes bacterium]|nr:FAD-dependent oxidoreductase [Bacillota bacterium]